MLNNERVGAAVANLLMQIDDAGCFNDYAALAYLCPTLTLASLYLCGSTLEEAQLTSLEEYCEAWGI